MKISVFVFTILILLLSLAASLAGALSYGQNDFRTFTTARGETVRVQYSGVYRYSLQALVTSGIPWDFVRLLFGIPLLLTSFILYLRGSLRGMVLFIGCLISFLYQYLLWTFDWAYNALYLVYVVLFSLSLWTLILVLVTVDRTKVQKAIGDHFPTRLVAGFSFAVGGLLLLKCLGEIVPSLGSNGMPAGAIGYYTLVDQALDLALLVPFSVLTGVLILRRNPLGYLLAPSSLITLCSIGLSVIAGEILLGVSSGKINFAGIVVFTIFIGIALFLLVEVLANIKLMKPIRS